MVFGPRHLIITVSEAAVTSLAGFSEEEFVSFLQLAQVGGVSNLGHISEKKADVNSALGFC